MLLWIAFALNYIDRQIAYSIFPVLRKQLGFSELQLGLVGAVFLWSYGAALVFTGRAADRLNRRALILVSLLLWSGATAGSGLSTSPVLFLVWRSVVGVSEAIYYPAASGLLATLHAAGTRSTALAVHQSAQLAGIVAGGWYGGWAADHIGWRQGLLAVALVGVGYAAILAFALQNLRSGTTESRAQHSTEAILLESRCFVALAIAFIAFCGMLWMIYAWLPSFLYERHGLTLAESGLVATAYLQISSAVGLLGAGVAADRLLGMVPAVRFYIAAAGLLLSPWFCIGLFSASTVTGVELCSIAFGVTAGLFQANIFAAAYDVIPADSYGTATGWLNVCGSIGGGVAVLLAGSLRPAVDVPSLSRYASMFTLCTGAALVSIVAIRFSSEQRIIESRLTQTPL
ncbi:MAG: MFS transporter [Acetobacteraceae bacterium]|nr:MFS transporter [Acetobacteraceae bacterium]